jgi:hypothetical protein
VLDQVIPDDLIVQSSLCVGFDCVDGESFGVDTIRMKENNTRLHFEDTSTSAGYAANDWRIIANDQPSGGANYLAVEDSTAARQLLRVDAGAPANSLYVSSNGDIGNKTATPGIDFHATVSDTPGIRLEQTNAGGFTAQTWDIAGNEANFFVRDLTGGSRLSFRIRPGAPTSSIDIAGDGDVGVGTASPNANTRMDLSDTTQLKARLALTGQEFFQAANTSTDGLGLVLGVNRTGNRQLWITDTAAMAVNTTNGVMRLRPNNGSIDSMSTSATAKPLLLQTLGGNIGFGSEFTPSHPLQHTSGAHLTSGGTWTNASSRSLKDNINELSADEALDALQSLKPVTFVYKADRNDPVVGFIAEDVPEIVATPDHKTLSPMDIVGVLTKVVQEQQKTIDELSKKIDGLEKQNQ